MSGKNSANPFRTQRPRSFDEVRHELVLAHSQLAECRHTVAAADAIHRHLGEGVIVVDRAGIIREVNPTALLLLGFGANELSGREIHEAIHHHRPDGSPYPRVDCHLLDVVNTGSALRHVEEAFVTKDGKFLPISVTVVPIREVHEITGAAFIFSDNTEREAASEALRAAETHRAAIFSTSIDAIITIDHADRVVDFNPAAERIFGYSREQAVGQRMAELIIPQRLREMHNRGMARYLETGEAEVMNRPLEMPALRADGTEFACELIITVIPQTPHPLFVGFVRDVSEARQRDRTLKFLFDLNQATMPLVEPEEIIALTARLLGEHLGVNRCAYAHVGEDENDFVVIGDYVRDTFSIVGRGALSDFGETVRRLLRQNLVFSIADAESDPRVEGHREPFRRGEIRAAIWVPLHKNGRLTATLAVQGRKPRQWTQSEVDLVQTVAHRAWESLERARGRQVLEESEERFRAVADNIAQLAWMADPNGSVFWYNQRWYDYTGTTLEEMRSAGWEKVHDPARVDRVKEKFQTQIERGEAWEDIFPLRGRDGRYRWFLTRAVPIRDEKQGVLRWFGTNTDITELRETQRALHESEERHRLIVENVKDFAIIGTDAAGIIVHWNPGAERVFGWAEAEALEQAIDLIFTPEDCAKGVPQQELATAKDTGCSNDERWHQNKAGERIFVSGAVRPIRNDAGELVGFNKVTRDITKRKQREQELTQSRELLESLVRERTAELEETIAELEAFSYSIAHDMRAPLRAMHQYAQILQVEQSERIDEDGRQQLQRIVGAANRMDRLIQDILSYSKLTRAQMLLEPLDLNTVVQHVIDDYPALPSEARIVVDGRLPAVLAHEAALTQCISNLFSNAVKFARKDVTPRVKVWAEERDATVRLWVEDNGIGIPPDARARIFDIFERVHSEREYAGTGIGLSIVRKAIERMGGEVGVDSEVGEGSRFWIELPKAP